MSRPAPICVPCALEMRCTKIGVIARDRPTGASPATCWASDMYSCEKCGTAVLAGFSDGYQSTEDVAVMRIDQKVLDFDHQGTPLDWSTAKLVTK